MACKRQTTFNSWKDVQYTHALETQPIYVHTAEEKLPLSLQCTGLKLRCAPCLNQHYFWYKPINGWVYTPTFRFSRCIVWAAYKSSTSCTAVRRVGEENHAQNLWLNQWAPGPLLLRLNRWTLGLLILRLNQWTSLYLELQRMSLYPSLDLRTVCYLAS